MDFTLERLIRRCIGPDGQFKPQKCLLDHITNMILDSCGSELNGLTQRVNLRSRSISSSGISTFTNNLDEISFMDRRIRSIIDVICFEPSFKSLKAQILKICHRISLKSEGRSSSDSRIFYSSTPESECLFALSSTSFGQTMKSVNGDEVDYLVRQLENGINNDIKKSSLEALLSISMNSIIKSKKLSHLMALFPKTITLDGCFNLIMDVLSKLLSTRELKVFNNFCEILLKLTENVFESCERQKKLQYSEFVLQFFSRSYSDYKFLSVNGRNTLLSTSSSLFDQSFTMDLIYYLSLLDQNANFVGICLLSFSSRNLFGEKFMKLLKLITTNGKLKNINSSQIDNYNVFIFCFINHLLKYNMIGSTDLIDSKYDSTSTTTFLVATVTTLLLELLGKKMKVKQIRKLLIKSILETTIFTFGASFYCKNLLGQILQLKPSLSTTILLNILKNSTVTTYKTTENTTVQNCTTAVITTTITTTDNITFDYNSIKQLLAKTLLQHNSVLFNISLQILLLLYEIDKSFTLTIVEGIDGFADKLDTKNGLHSKVLLQFNLSSKPNIWKLYGQQLSVSKDIYLIKHIVEFSTEDRRLAVKWLTNFLSKDDDVFLNKIPLDFVRILILQPALLSELIKSMNLCYLLEERMKTLYSNVNTTFLKNLVILTSAPEAMIEVRRNFSLWTKLVQYINTVYTNKIKEDESSDLIRQLIQQTLMAHSSELKGIHFNKLKSIYIQQFYQSNIDLAIVMFPKFTSNGNEKDVVLDNWNAFLNGERTETYKDVLSCFLAQNEHEKQRTELEMEGSVPDWLNPLMDYGIGLDLIKSRRKITTKLYNNHIFTKDKIDFFSGLLFLSLEFDSNVANKILAFIPRNTVFWPHSFSSLSLFSGVFTEKTFVIVENLLSNPYFKDTREILKQCKVPLFHLCLNWVYHCFMGTLPFMEVVQIIGYSLVLGEEFTAILIVVLLNHISSQIWTQNFFHRSSEDFLSPQKYLLTFHLNQHLPVFQKSLQILGHKI